MQSIKITMKAVILTLFCLFSILTFGQKKAELLEEINRDVWVPFQQGINTDVDQLYIDVHSEDFYWVGPGSKGRIMDFNEYVEDSKMVMARRRNNQEKSEIEIRFLERNVKGDFASEKCISMFSTLKPGAETQTGYGITRYFLRKENGTWKMILQYGSTEKATEDMFKNAAKASEANKF
ncbi:MAG: nuclear transport factor 2 family protein [Cyclobacteriaceae bacterium]|nr:nuclear transport factor 2 family protein [Cyclobacteriaceae bacterium]